MKLIIATVTECTTTIPNNLSTFATHLDLMLLVVYFVKSCLVRPERRKWCQTPLTLQQILSSSITFLHLVHVDLSVTLVILRL